MRLIQMTIGIILSMILLLPSMTNESNSPDKIPLSVLKDSIERLKQLEEDSNSKLIYFIVKKSIEFGISPRLTMKIISTESNWDANALSYKEAIGLMQVLYPTAQDYIPNITREQLYDPFINVLVGLLHLKYLLELYDGDVEHSLAAYNMGQRRLNRLMAYGYDVSKNIYKNTVMENTVYPR